MGDDKVSKTKLLVSLKNEIVELKLNAVCFLLYYYINYFVMIIIISNNNILNTAYLTLFHHMT